MRQVLEECDIAGARALWAQISPNMPQPANDDEALVSLHMARTQSDFLRFKLRAHSHHWLAERGFPSQLPDALRPKAERMYPVIVHAVGVAVKTASSSHRALGQAIQRAMSDAALECYADRKTDPEFVRARMLEARAKIRRG